MMLVYVAVYNMSIVTKGLRQPKRMARVENKALNMLADLKDNEPEAAESLMKRLTPDVREKIITHASKHLFNEELDRVAWDQVCDGLTFSEKEICKLILQGHTLKEICAELNKSESNITSQRCHIRKKLNMDRRDDLRRTLEVRFYDAQKQVKSQKPRTPDFYGYSYFLDNYSSNLRNAFGRYWMMSLAMRLSLPRSLAARSPARP